MGDMTKLLSILTLAALAALPFAAGTAQADDNPAQVVCSDGYVAAGPYCVNPIYINNPLFVDPATCVGGYYQGSCIVPTTAGAPAPSPVAAPAGLTAPSTVCNPATTSCVPPCNPATTSCTPPCNPAVGCTNAVRRTAGPTVENVALVQANPHLRPTVLYDRLP